MNKILETDRLLLRELTEGDAAFMYELLNSDGWLKFIGDRNISSVQDAKNHLLNNYIKMYEDHGFGLWAVVRKEDQVVIGTCGLIKRPSLPNIDIGFAFLPQYAGQGFAYEAAAATMNYGYSVIGTKKIVAITIPENDRSIKLLTKIGLVHDVSATIPDDPKCILFVPRDR